MSPRVLGGIAFVGLVGAGVVVLGLNGWRFGRQAPVAGPNGPGPGAAPSNPDAVATGDYAGFRAWLANKGTEADRAKISESETAWAERTVAAAFRRADDMRPFMPVEAREELHSTANELRTLADELKPDGTPFLAARQKLFTAALDEVQAEAHRLFVAGDSERAFGLARTHAVNWSQEARSLGPEWTTKLSRFRDGYEFLSTWGGTVVEGPSLAPTPRVRETAPPPRAKM